MRCLFCVVYAEENQEYDDYEEYAMYEEAANNLDRAQREFEIASALLRRSEGSRLLRYA